MASEEPIHPLTARSFRERMMAWVMGEWRVILVSFMTSCVLQWAVVASAVEQRRGMNFGAGLTVNQSRFAYRVENGYVSGSVGATWRWSVCWIQLYSAETLAWYEGMENSGAAQLRASLPDKVGTFPGWLVLPSRDGVGGVSYVAMGFPLRFLVQYLPWDDSLYGPSFTYLRISRHSRLGDVLNMHAYVLWPRLILNVMAVGVVVHMLLRAQRIVNGYMARRRRKRGQCEACGYLLAGLATCPECGTRLTPVKQESPT